MDGNSHESDEAPDTEPSGWGEYFGQAPLLGDPDARELEADPGCLHPWNQLNFLEGDQGLACTECFRTWLFEDEEELPDAVLSLWQSARTEFSLLERKIGRLTSFLERITPSTCCRHCGTWADPDALVAVGGVSACPQHIGAHLARLDDGSHELPISDAVGHLTSWAEDGTLQGQWLIEQNIAAWPALAEMLGRTMEVLREQAVAVPQPLQEALGLPGNAQLGLACDSLAEALDLDTPLSRAGLTYLLGLLAAPKGNESNDSAFPHRPTDRAIILMDLCRSDMPEDIEFTGDMADDVVRSIGERARDLLDPAIA